MLRSERSGSASAQEGGERRRDKPGGQPVIKAVPTFVLAGTLQVLLALRMRALDAPHKLRMELDHQSLFGLLCTSVLIG